MRRELANKPGMRNLHWVLVVTSVPAYVSTLVGLFGWPMTHVPRPRPLYELEQVKSTERYRCASLQGSITQLLPRSRGDLGG
jgi:hypothetical protein